MTAEHVWLGSKIEADLMIGARQRRCRNAEPRTRDGAVDVPVEEMPYITMLQLQPPKLCWIFQHAIVERADTDLEGRVV